MTKKIIKSILKDLERTSKRQRKSSVRFTRLNLVEVARRREKLHRRILFREL